MIETQAATLKQNWQLKSRSIYIHVPLFKMKLYKTEQSQNPYLFFHLPAVKKIVAYTPDLKTLLKKYKFPQDSHAFEINNVGAKDQPSRPYLVAGSTAGTIMCQPLAPNEGIQDQQSLLKQSFSLNTQDKDPQEIYINDILSLGNNKIVNCFNNGTIAFWDLNQKRRVFSLSKIHESYTYKLRRIDQRLISCGHDNMTVVTDLVKMRPISFLRNSDSCWCSTPLDYNVVASVGLFNRVNIWDVRAKLLIQSAQLVNGESSFVTVFDENNLVLGDGPVLKKCDLRTIRCNPFASENMLGSAESIIVTENGGGYACGRRFQICHFTAVEVAHAQPSVNKIYNPFNEGNMFMYETVFNQNNNRQQEEQQINDDNEQNQQWEEEDEQIEQDEQDLEQQPILIPNQQDFVELHAEEQQYRELMEEIVDDQDEEQMMQEIESNSMEIELSPQIEVQHSQQQPQSHELKESQPNNQDYNAQSN